MATLYELTGEYEQIINMLYDPDVDEQVIFDTMEGIEAAFEDKADGYAMIRSTILADVAAMKEEETRLSNRRKAAENRIKRLMGCLEDAMRFTGKTKFKTALFSFGIQKNGGKQPVAIDAEYFDIPAEFLIPQPPVVDKDKVRAFLETQPEGKTAWAHLEPRGESLRIR